MSIKICLDAGHGINANQGVYSGYYESNGNFALANILAEKLISRGYEVVKTKTEQSQDPSLTARGNMAQGCDMFLSLHSDASGNTSKSFVTAIRSLERPQSQELGAKLASAVKNLIAKDVPDITLSIYGGAIDGVWTKQGDYGDWYTVIYTAAQYPECKEVFLLECGHHTHMETCKWLDSGAKRETLAETLAETIALHFNQEPVPVPTPTPSLPYIDQLAAYVNEFKEQYGIKIASPIIAQSIKECSLGTSELAVNAQNYFGMKWRDNRCPTAIGKYNKKTSEWVNGEYIQIFSDFFMFSNQRDSVIGYFDFTNISNYNSLKGVTDPLTYLQNIKAIGYATAPYYVEDCMALIDEYNLTQYDDVEPVPSEPFVPHKLKIGFASSGDINSITELLSELAIAFTVENGYIYTDVAPSQGDYNSIKALCDSLGIPCVSIDVEPTPEPEPTPSTEVEELKAQLAEITALAEKYLYRAVNAEKALEDIQARITTYKEETL